MPNFLSTRLSADPAQPEGALQRLLQCLPGTALSAVIAMAATLVSHLHGGPQLLYALFFGVAFHYLSADAKTRPGIEFCSKVLLRTGVALLASKLPRRLP